MVNGKRIVSILLIGMLCISVGACRKKVDSDNIRGSIVFVEDIVDGKINIDAAYITKKSCQRLYYKNDIFDDDMFCDETSLQGYFLVKSTDENKSDLIYDYVNSKVYNLGFNRCSIIAETLNYIYIAVYDDHAVCVLALFKKDGSISMLGEVYSSQGEYYESIATSNYDEDVVHFCYALSDGTYAVSIINNLLSSKKISKDSLVTVISLDGKGEKYLAMYNAISTPFKFEAVIIDGMDDINNSKDIVLEEGGVIFSVIVNGNFYMAYSRGEMLEIYTINEDNMIVKMFECVNDSRVAYVVKDGILYLRVGNEIFSVT